ncbi:MAG: hypothetical protein H7237_10925 [Alkalinema sp. FL-bin-369]|nr:hypothetical protein [Leptolyngbyaceae cyanobacterium LF-bin-369]
MALDKSEVKQLLERMIFEETAPQDWAEDVWGLSPMMGDSALKLLEIFYLLIDASDDQDLEELLGRLYSDRLNP